MFDSGKTAKALIDELKSEVDIAVKIPDSSYVDWINAVEQTLYDNIVREELTNNDAFSGPIGTAFVEVTFTVNSLIGYDGEADEKAEGRFEDIVSIRCNDRELTRVSPNVGGKKLFPYTYWHRSVDIVNLVTNDSVSMYVKAAGGDDLDITTAYIVRPKLKTLTNLADNVDGRVRVPAEYLDMVKAKMRGEAYKLANEDALAAKWLADYNAQLEYFRAWIASKRGVLGV